MTSGPCLRGCRVVRRYMPTNIGNHSSVVNDECNNYVSMYFEPFQPLGPVNTGVPPSGGTYVPQTQVQAWMVALNNRLRPRLVRLRLRGFSVMWGIIPALKMHLRLCVESKPASRFR